MLETTNFAQFSNESGLEISQGLLETFRKRKTTRYFKKAQVDQNIILNAIAVAATAPNGANKQPWSFAVIKDDDLKLKIRQRAEEEETLFYDKHAPKKWLDDLKPLHTNAHKPFITEASYLIPVFSKNYEVDETQGKANNYYVRESVGLATGFLIATLHLAGLSVLTYTPTNKNFMVDLLGRPTNEKTFMVLVVGLPAEGAQIPVLSKKCLNKIISIYDGVEPRNPETA